MHLLLLCSLEGTSRPTLDTAVLRFFSSYFLFISVCVHLVSAWSIGTRDHWYPFPITIGAWSRGCLSKTDWVGVGHDGPPIGGGLDDEPTSSPLLGSLACPFSGRGLDELGGAGIRPCPSGMSVGGGESCVKIVHSHASVLLWFIREWVNTSALWFIIG